MTASGGGQEKQQSDPLSLRGTSQGTGLQSPEQWPHPPSPSPKPSLTLRTDTRKMQGSSRPVAGLALILHTKVNRFRHRTQFSCTSSLRARHTGEHAMQISAQGARRDRTHLWGGNDGRGERKEGEFSPFTLYHRVTTAVS